MSLVMTKPAARICLVTSTLEGLSPTDAAAWHSSRVARFFAVQGREVTILYTGEAIAGMAALKADWAAKYRIGLEALGGRPAGKYPLSPAFIEKSWNIHEWLSARPFDLVHFQDRSADGFVSLEAKVTGLSFEKTELGFYLHGPEAWKGEIAREVSGPERLFVDYAVGYCAQHADHLMAPAGYFWFLAEKKKWQPASRRYVLPYLPAGKEAGRAEKSAGEARHHLVYFTKAGESPYLIIFLRALAALAQKNHSLAERLDISFLHQDREPDRHGVFSLAKEYLKAHLPQLEWSAERFEDGIDRLNRLPVENGLVLFSPLHAASPYLYQEALNQGKNVLAPGLPEISGNQDEYVHSEWNRDFLAKKISEFVEGKNVGESWAGQEDEAERAWRKYLEERPAPMVRVRPVPEQLPRVSVCIAHFNKGDLLAETLDSLRAQTYSNFEVIVADDASDDPSSLAHFRELAGQHRPLGWKFIEGTQNQGPGYARNAAARQADGELLYFLDADDLPYPYALEKMVRAILSPGIDCIGASTDLFRMREGRREIFETGTYLGSSLEYGFLLPPSGTNSLIRREVFQKLGGFLETRSLDCDEDWHFHIKLLGAGYSLQILPCPVYEYRAAQIESRSHLMARNVLHNLEPLLKGAEPWQLNLIQYAQAAVKQIDEAIKLRRELEEWKRSPLGRLARFLRRTRIKLGRRRT